MLSEPSASTTKLFKRLMKLSASILGMLEPGTTKVVLSIIRVSTTRLSRLAMKPSGSILY